MMESLLEKWRKGDATLEAERNLMHEALARIDKPNDKTTVRPPARLIFGLDLTASRQASLEQARIATAAMFDTIRESGSIAVKMVYFRGEKECRQSAWHERPDGLCRSMLRLSCACGSTQICRMLRMVLAEKLQLSGIVYVGDCCEDNTEELMALGESLAQKAIPLFVFHECADGDHHAISVKPLFKNLTEVTRGAYVEFRPDAGEVLREMLVSIAAYSVGGSEAVDQLALPVTAEGRQLRSQLMLSAGGGKLSRST